MLYNKYRPKTKEQLIGQPKVSAILETLFSKPITAAPQVWMLKGPYGTGKTTTTRIIADYFKVHKDSFIELNGSNTNSVNDMRDLVDSIQSPPMFGDYTLVVIDECHRLSAQAWDSLLKPLEEPPKHVIFLLATSEVNKKIPVSESGRVMELKFDSITNNDMYKILKNVCIKEEKMIEKLVAKAIVLKAEGCARHAITLLESVLDLDSETAIGIIESDSGEETEEFKQLCKLLMAGGSWDGVRKCLKTIKADPETMRYKILQWMGSCLLNGCDNEEQVNDVISFFSDSFVESGKAGLISACYECSQ